MSEKDPLLGTKKISPGSKLRAYSISIEPIRGILRLLFRFRATSLQRVFWKLVAGVILSVAICVLKYFFPKAFPIISIWAHMYSAPAIVLLLVFRTVSAASRYWEGRLLFETILTRSVILCLAMFNMDGMTKEIFAEITELILAFVHAVKVKLSLVVVPIRPTTLTHTFSFRSNLSPNFNVSEQHEVAEATVVYAELMEATPRHFSEIVQQHNPPLYIIFKAATLARTLPNPMHANELVLKLCSFIPIQESLEKITSTPMPYAYAVQLTQVLFLWCFTLPLAIVTFFNWVTPVIVAFIMLCILGINELADEIEDPFGDDLNDLPIPELIDEIKNNLQGLTRHYEQQCALGTK